MKQNQAGFTLIEIAIVLVIIGLLLGGVLKGQELINSAKVKNIATDFRNIPLFIYGYQDKYRALPGDDPKVTDHLGSNGTQAASSVAGNGTIDGTWNASTISTTEETQIFWQHVRLAGLAAGTTANNGDLRPTNATGGAIGIQSNNSTFTTITKDSSGTASLMGGTYIICSEGILGKYVKQLDITLDDGNTDTGSMRTADPKPANVGHSMAMSGTNGIQDGQGYTVCMGI